MPGRRQRRPVDPQSILQAVWRQYSHLGGALQVCFAFFDASASRHIFRFDSTDNFRPVETDDVITLGWPDECSFL